MGKNYQDSVFIDSVKIIYPEFCGSSSEIDAFEADVEFAASNRNCVTYSIRKLADQSHIFDSTFCGAPNEQENFQEYLDSLTQVISLTLDVELQIDTIVSNPGKWECK
jgi:hypothetical protein